METRSITATHPQYDEAVGAWNRITDICRGRDEDVRKYLIELNPGDASEENRLRNLEYRRRAVFVRIAGRTVNGMLGMVFKTFPKLSIPEALDYVKSNADGAGVSVYQQSQKALRSVISKGRAGLFVDYPAADGPLSVADMNAGRAFATVQRFEPEQIINWGLVNYGATVKLGRVVVKEDGYDVYGNAFSFYRELFLDDGGYVAREWRRDADGEWAVYSETRPRDGGGRPWDEIPFVFVGAETNAAAVNDPPMYDICSLNIGHYNNSADYEDSAHFVGQPQYWMSGMDPDVLEMFKKEKAYVGSRMIIGVPAGEQLAIAQPQPNAMIKEAMDDKIKLAIGMGAFFITPGSAVKTATQSAGEQEMQHSILSLASSNLGEAYTQCLEWMARYMAIDPDALPEPLLYEPNHDFVESGMDAQTLTALTAAWAQGALPYSDYVARLQKAELIDPEKTADEAKEEIESGRGGGAFDLDDDDGESNESEA